jgi:hypothetical protein
MSSKAADDAKANDIVPVKKQKKDQPAVAAEQVAADVGPAEESSQDEVKPTLELQGRDRFMEQWKRNGQGARSLEDWRTVLPAGHLQLVKLDWIRCCKKLASATSSAAGKAQLAVSQAAEVPASGSAASAKGPQGDAKQEKIYKGGEAEEKAEGKAEEKPKDDAE